MNSYIGNAMRLHMFQEKFIAALGDDNENHRAEVHRCLCGHTVEQFLRAVKKACVEIKIEWPSLAEKIATNVMPKEPEEKRRGGWVEFHNGEIEFYQDNCFNPAPCPENKILGMCFLPSEVVAEVAKIVDGQSL